MARVKTTKSPESVADMSAVLIARLDAIKATRADAATQRPVVEVGAATPSEQEDVLGSPVAEAAHLPAPSEETPATHPATAVPPVMDETAEEAPNFSDEEEAAAVRQLSEKQVAKESADKALAAATQRKLFQAALDRVVELNKQSAPDIAGHIHHILQQAVRLEHEETLSADLIHALESTFKFLNHEINHNQYNEIAGTMLNKKTTGLYDLGRFMRELLGVEFAYGKAHRKLNDLVITNPTLNSNVRALISEVNKLKAENKEPTADLTKALKSTYMLLSPKNKMKTEQYEEIANTMEGKPNNRMQRVGAIMLAICALLALLSPVVFIPPVAALGVVSFAALGYASARFFAQGMQSGLSKKMSDVDAAKTKADKESVAHVEPRAEAPATVGV